MQEETELWASVHLAEPWTDRLLVRDSEIVRVFLELTPVSRFGREMKAAPDIWCREMSEQELMQNRGELTGGVCVRKTFPGNSKEQKVVTRSVVTV